MQVNNPIIPPLDSVLKEGNTTTYDINQIGTIKVDATKRICSATYGRPFKRVIGFSDKHYDIESGAMTIVYEKDQLRLEVSQIDDGDSLRITIPISELINTYSGDNTQRTRLSTYTFKFEIISFGVTGNGLWVFLRIYKRSPGSHTINTVATDSQTYTTTGFKSLELAVNANMDDDYLYEAQIELYGYTGSSSITVWCLQTILEGFEEL